MKIYFATFVYCILTTQLSHVTTFLDKRADSLIVEMGGLPIVNEPNARYCDDAAPGNWFIVVDASYYNDDNSYQVYRKTKDNYNEQKQIAEQMINYISTVNKIEVNSDDKHEICVILASNNKVDVIRTLCKNKTVDDSDERLPVTVEPTPQGISPGEVLNEIDKQPTHCNWRPNRQRFVLYIAQNAKDSVFDQAIATLNRWKDDPDRSTIVVFIIISEAGSNGFRTVLTSDPNAVRGRMYFNPQPLRRGGPYYQSVRYFVGQYAVQCSCSWSEDCRTKNRTATKPCHFQMDGGKELCTMTVEREVDHVPPDTVVRPRNRILPSCWSNATRNFECIHAECEADCEKKGWLEWSNCENHWNEGYFQKRSRKNEKAGRSQFTKSCRRKQNRTCTPPVQNTTSKATPSTGLLFANTLHFGTTTTMASQTNVSAAIWGLFFALIVLSGSIVAAAFIVIRVKRHRRRRRAHLPPKRPATKIRKGHQRDVGGESFVLGQKPERRPKPTSAKVDKKKVRRVSASPHRLRKQGKSLGGSFEAVGGSSLSLEEVQTPPRRSTTSSKVGKVDQRVSVAQSSMKANKNLNRSFGPLGASLKVSLLEDDRRLMKNSQLGKVGPSKSSHLKKVG